MDPRLERVLTLVIETHIATAEPVGSQALVDQHDLGVSPATVRNWFAELVSAGMLVQPHTSAGRVPSEAAYQWYVETQLGEPSIEKREHVVFARIAEETADHAARAKAIAKMCAGAVGIAALAGTGRNDSYYTGMTELFRQPEFREWNRVLGMGSVLDTLDERLTAIRGTTYHEPTILLGDACPFGNACGAVVVTLPGNAIIALFGPLRMPYRTARNLLHAARNALK
jgi:transcriptional regulator of heat shock response